MLNEMKRVTSTMLLLGLLTKQDMYASQLCQEISKSTNGTLKFSPCSMYPILYRMKKQGLVSDHEELIGKRKTCVYYHIEPKGFSNFKELKQQYLSIHDGLLAFFRTLEN